MLENVDDIFAPIKPDLPMPLNTACPVHFSKMSMASVQAVACARSDSILWMTELIALFSATRTSQINPCSADKAVSVSGRGAFMKL